MPIVRRKPHADILTVPFVRQLVATQFPQWADLPLRPLDRGWDNTTFRLGDEMTVRLPSGPRYAPQVDKEQEWLPKLAPQLPLPIPVPVGKGTPTPEFPFPWSVRRWIEGEMAETTRIDDPSGFAAEVAAFLVALQSIDATGGPAPGQHSYFRGCSVTFDDPSQTPPATPGNWAVQDSIARLRDAVDGALATEVWEAGLAAGEPDSPVWVHGDVYPSNLLVRDGRLHAVIDWGCSAVGDPACDLGIAWAFFSGASREAFRANLSLDDAAWARGRAWALWVPLYRLADAIESRAGDEAAFYGHLIDEILEDHKRRAG